MSIEVALIDFPRLQEQIAARVLAPYNAHVRSVHHNEAAQCLDLFDLVLFFWPDTGSDTNLRLNLIRGCKTGKEVPIMLVTSETGKRNAEAALGKSTPFEFLLTPLQPHVVVKKLAQILGNHTEPLTFWLDADYVNPFISATLNTLKSMANLDCERTGLFARTEAVTNGQVSGTMGLSGTAEGFVSITFGNELARKIACRVLQIPMGMEKDADVRDTVGELMNIIAGAAKADLVNTAHSFQLSLPTVIMGGSHSVGQLRGVPVIVIEFTAEGDTFEVMVCLLPKKR